MNRRNPIETILGALVLAVAAMFLVFAYSVADLRAVTGYDVTAKFLKVGGLERGSDVRISGITIGSVTAQKLNPETFEAQVTMSIAPEVVLPTDTEAAIVSDGLLGGKYVNLVPGRSNERIAAGGFITRTRDFQSLEDLVGEIIFLATNNSGGGAAPAPVPPAAETAPK